MVCIGLLFSAPAVEIPNVSTYVRAENANTAASDASRAKIQLGLKVCILAV